MVASVGTVTTTLGDPTVVGDATAAAAWQSKIGLITLCQFRNPNYSLYNIVAYDGNATLTLDRPWMEPVSGAGLTYWMYQTYFPVPVADFNKFIEIRDTTFNAQVSFTEKSQSELAWEDPKRLIFGPRVPTYAVPYGVDKRAGSATLGYVMYEIWPHNLSTMPYSFSYKRRGPMLVNPADVVPYPLDDELVTHRVKELLYLHKEAQKGENIQRGSGADWRFLAQAAGALFKEKLKTIRAKDANLHRDFVTKRKDRSVSGEPYSTPRLGQLNIGR